MGTKKKPTAGSGPNVNNELNKHMTYYKDAEAARLGLGSTPTRHGASRNPYTGLLLKKPGHPTVNLSVREDKKQGYRTYQYGNGLGSFEKSDPRGRAGAANARRDRDISGATYDSDTEEAIRKGKAPRTSARRKKRKIR
jgi:hypothetical protein